MSKLSITSFSVDKSRYAPYETVNVTAKIKNTTLSEKSVRIQLYQEAFPTDPMHYPLKLFAAKVGYIGALQTVTVTGSFTMYQDPGLLGAKVSVVTAVDENLTWVNDAWNVIVANQSDSSEPPDDDTVPCQEGYGYCGTGANKFTWYYCENGVWKEERNSAHCGYVPDGEGCTGTTKWWAEGGVLYTEENSVDCGYVPPGEDEDEEEEDEEEPNQLAEVMKYLAIGAGVFAVSMLVIPKKRKTEG